MKKLLMIVMVIVIVYLMPYNKLGRTFSSMSYTNSRGEMQGLYLGDTDVTEEYKQLSDKILNNICVDLKTKREELIILSITLLEYDKITIEIYSDPDKHTYVYDLDGRIINHNTDEKYKYDEWEKIRIEGIHN